MYQSSGASPNEIGDIDIIAHDGVLHLFHLVLPNHDYIAHATSRDGLCWTPAPAALRTGDPGDCDDDMLWTMHTVKKPDADGFFMYYTACSTREQGQVQRVAMAQSSDLVRWTKHEHNPILEAQKPHYNEDRDLVGFVSFRDPFVFIENGVWHMLVTARENAGPRFRRGCVAHAISNNGVDWKLQPPLYAPGAFEDLETPALFQLENHYYLFFNVFGAGFSRYRIADLLNGPWRAPERDVLLPASNSVFRFSRWKDKLLAFHWIRAEADWHQRGGNSYVALAPPKEVVVQPDGTLSFAPFSGWGKYFDGAPQELPPGDFAEKAGDGQWAELSTREVRATANGLATARSESILSDFVAEFDLQMNEGNVCGLAFRVDESFEIANWLRFDFTKNSVELHRTMYFDSAFHRYKLKTPTLIQSAPANIKRGQKIRVRLLACREYIEVALNGVVYLSAITYKARSGCLAFCVEDGDATFSPVSVQTITKSLSDSLES